jgi:hypothetical protein
MVVIELKMGKRMFGILGINWARLSIIAKATRGGVAESRAHRLKLNILVQFWLTQR